MANGPNGWSIALRPFRLEGNGGSLTGPKTHLDNRLGILPHSLG